MVPRSVTLVVALGLLVLAFPPVPAAGPACEDLVFLPHVGLVCPVGNGLYEVFDPSGRSVAYTHGADVDEEPQTAAATARAPTCVSATTPYRAVVIYARATDDVDQSATMAGTIRNLVSGANGYVHEAAVATGGQADLRVQCTEGVVDVLVATLPTPIASTTFQTVVSDLRAQGFTDGTAKYWVWFDQNTCSCGVGHVYGDDSLVVGNSNNGNAAAMFAVTFGVNSVRVWLHEYSHNMGAVQNSAPHTTNGLHCTDGRDTMCYDDGASNGGAYTTSACAVEVYDCGKDDYFHRAPVSGSYLATHWNVGSSLNRFVRFVDGPPAVDLVDCGSSVVRGVATTCSFRAFDDTSGVYLTVDWGDGATARIPETGTVASGSTVTAVHTWNAVGAVTVSATATDALAQTGPPRTTSFDVVEGPLMRLLSCPSSVGPGATATCTFRADDDGFVRYDVDWGDGTTTTVPASGTVAPGVDRTADHVYATGGTRTVRVTASDTDGHTSLARNAFVRAYAAPVMTALSCPATRAVGVTLTCTFTATDGDSSKVRYLVDWGDGATTTVPATGYVAPGAPRQATHTYTAAGTYAIRVSATDDGDLASAARSFTTDIVVDTTPPSITVVDPVPGTGYVGCTATFPAPSAPPTYVARGCARMKASDAASGVATVQALLDGVVVGTFNSPGPNATVSFEFPVAGVSTARTLVLRATDGVGNVATTPGIVVATVAG